MIVEKNGYSLEVIDAPLVRHCIELERKIQEAKAVNVRAALESALSSINEIIVADENAHENALTAANKIAKKLRRALEALTQSETMTLSADNAIIVNAARASGWLVTCRKEEKDILPASAEDISPPWLCQWIAEIIMLQYRDAMTIPKN